jgi:hypothetical protein
MKFSYMSSIPKCRPSYSNVKYIKDIKFLGLVEWLKLYNLYLSKLKVLSSNLNTAKNSF